MTQSLTILINPVIKFNITNDFTPALRMTPQHEVAEKFPRDFTIFSPIVAVLSYVYVSCLLALFFKSGTITYLYSYSTPERGTILQSNDMLQLADRMFV